MRWLIILLVNGLVGCASLKPERIAVLPQQVYETSGLLSVDSALWTMNDSQHDSILYKLNLNGLVVDSVIATQVPNVDWEELFSDENHIYIADIGNNVQQRDEFQIYIVNREDLMKAEAESKEIIFKLPDPPLSFPKRRHRNFDFEAAFVKENYIYFISKNVKPCGKSFGKLYRVPATTGHHIAEVIDSFQFDEPVTGATYNDILNDLVVTGYLSCFVFEQFDGNKFSKAPSRLRYNRLRQYEGISFSENGQRLYLSSEKGFGKKAALFEIPIDDMKGKKNGGIFYFWRRFKLSVLLNAYNWRINNLSKRKTESHY